MLNGLHFRWRGTVQPSGSHKVKTNCTRLRKISFHFFERTVKIEANLAVVGKRKSNVLVQTDSGIIVSLYWKLWHVMIAIVLLKEHNFL